MNNSSMRNHTITTFTISFLHVLESNNLSTLEVLAPESEPAIIEGKTFKIESYNIYFIEEINLSRY